MKISASVVGMEYSHSRSIELVSSKSRQSNSIGLATDQVSISVEARQKYSSYFQQKFNALSQVNNSSTSTQPNQTKQFVTEVTGSILSMFQTNMEGLTVRPGAMNNNNSQTLPETTIVKMNEYQFIKSDENSQFASTGIIETEDGRKIEFSLSLHLQHTQVFESTKETTIVQQFIDPLVINFESESVNLTDTFFSFDLNGDGVTEQIAQLGTGSGYLALDHNKNGVIDNGLELFGPATGQGFSELSQYDSDNNLWIDENDPIFNELKLWIQDGSDTGTLKTLSEAGVGAIYLGHSNDDFNLVSRQGMLLGNIKGTGIVLMESGEVKTIQEIDLATQQNSTISNDTNITKGSNQTRANIDQIVNNNLSLGQNLDSADQEAASENNMHPQFVNQVENIIEKLHKLREEQKAYSQRILDQGKEHKSLVEQLVDTLEEQNKEINKNDSRQV